LLLLLIWVFEVQLASAPGESSRAGTFSRVIAPRLGHHAPVTDALPRLATSADNAALLDLFGDVPMRGELVLATRREPDFFSLYRMQRAEPFVYVADGPRGLTGMCTALLRDGWLDGAPTKVGYLGDLRVRFDRSRAFARFFGEYFDDLCQRTGCTRYYTSILASNQAALRALTRKRSERSRQPHYELLRPFTTVSVQLTFRPKDTTGLRVDSARPDDVPALVALLDADHRRRPFGYRFDDGELEHRLAHWPGFTLDSTLVAKDGAGRPLGVATVWNPQPVKRFQVRAYGGSMRWVKRGYDLAASVLRWPKLPDPGHEFRYAYLANVSVLNDDVRVFRALLEAAYRRLHGSGLHFFSFDLGRDDPWWPAVKGFVTQKLDFALYAVTPQGQLRTEWPTGRTGFEVALA
jgi:hypothetical protein